MRSASGGEGIEAGDDEQKGHASCDTARHTSCSDDRVSPPHCHSRIDPAGSADATLSRANECDGSRNAGKPPLPVVVAVAAAATPPMLTAPCAAADPHGDDRAAAACDACTARGSFDVADTTMGGGRVGAGDGAGGTRGRDGDVASLA
jgi:hypothetical protein